MKTSKFVKLTKSTLLPIILTIGGFLGYKNNVSQVLAYSPSSLPTTIDLNEVNDEDIRDYYSAIDSKSVDQRRGNNLLKNLKPILMDGQQYFSYDTRKDDIWKAYEIIDRDWELSPATEIINGSYNSQTKIISNYQYKASTGNDSKNPYIHALYVNRDMDNPMRAWGNHTQGYGGINQEHIWPKSHGFDTSADGGARGDLMHLWAADGYSNNMHNNWAYGNVDPNKIDKKSVDKIAYATDNLLGTSLTLGSGTVFEPQDSDKGDVARALFYMAARYNNFAGATSGINSNDPFLILDDYAVKEAGTSAYNKPMKYGVLTDLLEWNKLDPVDEFERKRNDILYRNFTKNRNPFIDFPQWADAIWGDYENDDTLVATPKSDVINNKKDKPIDTTVDHLEITSLPFKTSYCIDEVFSPAGMEVTAHFTDGSKQVIKNYQYPTNKFSVSGKQTVTISYKEKTVDISIEVVPKLSLEPGTYTFTIDVESFNGSNIQSNNKEKCVPIDGTSSNAYFYSNNVWKRTGMCFRAIGGYICTTIPMGSIQSVTITPKTGTEPKFDIYYGPTIKPTSNSQPGGRYFAIYNEPGSAAYLDKIVVTFTIDNNPVTTGITLKGDYQKEFKCNGQFSSQGLEVYETFDNGSEQLVTSNINVIPPSMEDSGNDIVTVQYKNNKNEIFEATYDITIENYIVDITMICGSDLTVKYGEKLDKSSIFILAVYADGETQDVTKDAVFNEPSTQKVGDVTMCVSYEAEGQIFTKNFTIHVLNFVTSIEATGDYYNEFIVGDTFDSEGLKVKVNYADGSSEIIDEGFTVSGPKGELKIGEKEVTIKYVVDGETFKTTYTIYIVDETTAIIDTVMGCFGSNVCASLIVALFSFLGCGFLLRRKREN